MLLDRLNNIDPRKAGAAGMVVLNAIQTLPQEDQIVGIALAFSALVRQYQLSYPQVLTVVNNVREHAEFFVPELRAVGAYVKGEL